MAAVRDTYKRRFVGNTAQCGCRWMRSKRYGDVLVECPLHKRATAASVAVQKCPTTFGVSAT